MIARIKRAGWAFAIVRDRKDQTGGHPLPHFQMAMFSKGHAFRCVLSNERFRG
jgi:hypothetical protein